jgi:hypothetical protein
LSVGSMEVGSVAPREARARGILGPALLQAAQPGGRARAIAID